MRNSRPNIPSRPSQNRQAILRQSTAATEEKIDVENTTSDRTNRARASQAHGESVEPAERALYPSDTSKFSLQKISAIFTIGIAFAGGVWYLASQDSTVKNLVDDTKDLKKKFDETSRISIESSIRINSIEQRITASETRERSNYPAIGAAPQRNVNEQIGATPKETK